MVSICVVLYEVLGWIFFVFIIDVVVVCFEVIRGLVDGFVIVDGGSFIEFL